MYKILLALFFSFVVSDFTAQKDRFNGWISSYNKKYVSEVEYLRRLAIFLDNEKKIENLNANSNGGATFEMNKFGDLTADEFRKFLGFVPRNRSFEVEKLKLNVNAAPNSFDWASKNKITPVKDQAQCGSCWAFSATENIESVWMIAKGLTPSNFQPLAPQQIVDCDNSDGGCNGGDTITAYEYVIQAGGQERETDYPYKAKNEACHFQKSKVEVSIKSYKYATTTKNENEMKEATYSVSPLSICVDAEPWQFYSGGVMTRSQCGLSLDHCVQITAYNTAVNPPYWKVRNSWGADWGEKGYIRLEYGTNTCGVAEEATTAVV